MGAGIYIMLNSADPGFDYEINGKALSRSYETLSNATERLGLPCFLDFFSAPRDAAIADMESLGVDTSTLDIPDEQWFEPSEGIAMVRALKDDVRDHPENFPKRAVVEAVLADVERVLCEAENRELKWHTWVEY